MEVKFMLPYVQEPQPQDFDDEDDFLSAYAQWIAAKPKKECVEEICNTLESTGSFVCHHCSSSEVEKTEGARFVYCINCKKKSWRTARSFFSHMRNPKAWLAATRLLEMGVCISAKRFAKFFGIADASAWYMYKKITMALQNESVDKAISVPSSLFGSIFSKRSRETPARAKPIAEQEELEKLWERESSFSNESYVDTPNSEPPQEPAGTSDVDDLVILANSVYPLLSRVPIHFDTLIERSTLTAGRLSAALVILELDGKAQRRDGDFYVAIAQPKRENGDLATPVSPVELANNVSAAIKFIREKFHGTSRKYLQNFLTMYLCFMDRQRWQDGSVLDACIRSGQIERDAILRYVTPEFVKILPC